MGSGFRIGFKLTLVVMDPNTLTSTGLVTLSTVTGLVIESTVTGLVTLLTVTGLVTEETVTGLVTEETVTGLVIDVTVTGLTVTGFVIWVIVAGLIVTGLKIDPTEVKLPEASATVVIGPVAVVSSHVVAVKLPNSIYPIIKSGCVVSTLGGPSSVIVIGADTIGL